MIDFKVIKILVHLKSPEEAMTLHEGVTEYLPTDSKNILVPVAHSPSRFPCYVRFGVLDPKDNDLIGVYVPNTIPSVAFELGFKEFTIEEAVAFFNSFKKKTRVIGGWDNIVTIDVSVPWVFEAVVDRLKAFNYLDDDFCLVGQYGRVVIGKVNHCQGNGVPYVRFLKAASIPQDNAITYREFCEAEILPMVDDEERPLIVGSRNVSFSRNDALRCWVGKDACSITKAEWLMIGYATRWLNSKPPIYISGHEAVFDVPKSSMVSFVNFGSFTKADYLKVGTMMEWCTPEGVLIEEAPC